MIRAAIIDDHPLARMGITQILTGSGRVMVTAAVATAAELANELEHAVPDIVVFDPYHAGEQAPPMVPLLLVLLLALVLGGVGFAVHVLWWIALVVLVLMLWLQRSRARCCATA